MTKLNYGRKGPPRPGSGSGHPFGAERPYKPPKTDADRKREHLELLAEEAAREAAIAPVRARQERRDARNALKQGGPVSFRWLAEAKAKIPKPPNTKS